MPQAMPGPDQQRLRRRVLHLLARRRPQRRAREHEAGRRRRDRHGVRPVLAQDPGEPAGEPPVPRCPRGTTRAASSEGHRHVRERGPAATKPVAAQVHEILSSMGYDYASKGVCFLHVEEVYSVTPGEGAGDLAGIGFRVPPAGRRASRPSPAGGAPAFVGGRLEVERAGARLGGHQHHRHALAQTVHGAGLLAAQAVAGSGRRQSIPARGNATGTNLRPCSRAARIGHRPPRPRPPPRTPCPRRAEGTR